MNDSQHSIPPLTLPARGLTMGDPLETTFDLWSGRRDEADMIDGEDCCPDCEYEASQPEPIEDDPFRGSAMTGVAATMLSRSTQGQRPKAYLPGLTDNQR